MENFLAVYNPLCRGPKSADRSNGFYSWISEVFDYSQEWMLLNRGLDAVMYLRFQKSCLVLFSGLSILSFITVVPANASGTHKDLDPSDRDYVSGLGVISLSNVEKGSPLLLIHLIFLIISTFIFMYLQSRDHKLFSQLRLMQKRTNNVQNYSVCLKNISFPQNMFSLKDKTHWLKNYLNNMFDDSVLYVKLVWNEPDLDEMKEDEDELQRGLERARGIALKTGKTPEHLVGIGNTVDAVSHYQKELNSVRHLISNRQSNTEPDLFPVAFVIFKSVSYALLCSQTNITRVAEQFETSPAPDPRGVVWEHLGFSENQIWIRRSIVYTLSFFLVLFYMIPITFIQSLANLRELADTNNWDGLKDFLDDNPTFEGLFQGLVPPLILIIFMAILLPILRLLSTRQGYSDIGTIERSTLNKFFFFQVFHVFLATTLAGSALRKLGDIVSEPSSIVPLFANSLPSQGNFFVTFVLLASTELAVKLLDPFRLAKYYFFSNFRCQSEREFREIEAGEPFDYVEEYANDLLIVQISITYSVMFPIILPFTAVYFLINNIVSRYRITYICETEVDTEGVMWTNAFVYMSVGLVICNLTMSGVFGLYKFPGAFICLILAGITSLFTVTVLSIYWGVATYGAIDEVTTSVDENGQFSDEIEELPLIPDEIFSEEDLLSKPDYFRLWYSYIQPCLVPPGPSPLPPLRLNNRTLRVQEDGL